MHQLVVKEDAFEDVLHEKSDVSQLSDMLLTAERPPILASEAIAAGGEIYEQALFFAKKAHAGQIRKGTQIPYIVHPVEASIIVGQVRLEQQGELNAAAYQLMAAAVL